MKKLLIFGLILTLFISISSVASFSAQENTKVIKTAIEKYKNRNFIGCISDLKIYTDEDPSSAIAWYYLGSAYMNIAMKNEAHNAFDRVIQLNTVPKLTSYSIQANMCMEDPSKCNYQNFNSMQIRKLQSDPMEFLDDYFASLSNKRKDVNIIEIEKLINGTYDDIHPSAKEFIMQEKAKMKRSEINEK